MFKIRLFNLALVSALVSVTLFSMLGFSSSCNEMYDNIIRIRILANSDSQIDQELKFKVRDAVLEKSKSMFGEVNTYEDALAVTDKNLDALRETAQNTVYELGFDYSVAVCFKEEFFDTREYEDFTLPAGKYKTAVFTLGEGKGKNWWCVIFPQVCVGACSGSLEDTLSKETADKAYNSKNYTVKFKTVEIFENIKKYLDF
ncbi:MAG: stage II sporulation protein R [Ruminococcaceae bacterium]|nr:stage II sporulation protein R [Oscillospiraceae bacterium]